MKNLKAYVFLLSVLITGTLFSSCKKDKTEIKTDLLYEVTVDGATATFSIKTEV
jgi:hypothetical protein